MLIGPSRLYCMLMRIMFVWNSIGWIDKGWHSTSSIYDTFSPASQSVNQSDRYIYASCQLGTRCTICPMEQWSLHFIVGFFAIVWGWFLNIDCWCCFAALCLASPVTRILNVWNVGSVFFNRDCWSSNFMKVTFWIDSKFLRKTWDPIHY